MIVLGRPGQLWSMRLACSFAIISIVGTIPVARAQSNGDVTASSPTSWTPEFYLVLVFCLLGFSVLAMQFVLFLRSSERISANDIMRAFSTTLILISVVALVGVGYTQQQAQPAYGVIGTLLGYLMGRGTLAGDLPRSPQRRKPDDALDASDN